MAPKNEDLIVPGGTSAKITRTDADGKCVIADQFQIVPAIIDPQAYPVLLKTEAALREKSSTLFLLK